MQPVNETAAPLSEAPFTVLDSFVPPSVASLETREGIVSRAGKVF